MMSISEIQVLKMLITLQCLTKAGPRRPDPGYVCQCIESIMCPMMAMSITFTAHAALVSAPLTGSSWSTSLKTDVSVANVSSLLSSVGLAGDLVRKVNTEAEMEILTVASTGTPTEVPTGDNTIDKKI